MAGISPGAAVKETCVARNRFYNRSGFTPYQRAFGYNPRMPASLLSDDILDPILVNISAAEDVQRSWQIRDMAAQSCLRALDEDTVKRALKSPTKTTDQTPLNAGDWCYVSRSTNLHSGWSGPGVIVAISPNQRTMWVSLRGSLLKVPKEHVRPTTGEEDLGRVLAKELSLEMIKDIKSGKLSRYHDLSEELPGEEDEQPFEAEVKPMEALQKKTLHPLVQQNLT